MSHFGDRPGSDPRSLNDLLARALRGRADDHEAAAAVRALQTRGSREVLDAARGLLRSAPPLERLRGAQILGELGVPVRVFSEECVDALLEALRREGAPEVLHAVAVALGHHPTPRSVDALVKLKNHPHAQVRLGVALGLLGREEGDAIAAMVELSADPDDDVRDWSTFGLASQIDTDTLELRRALLGRLEDLNEGARNEALLGLSRRGEKRVLSALLRELRSAQVNRLAVEAAEELGDPRLHDALEDLSHRWDEDPELIAHALLRCSPSRHHGDDPES